MSRASRQAAPLRIESRDLYQLNQDLRAADRKLATAMRQQMRGVAEPLKRAVQQEASWSTRIPGATRVQTTFGRRRQRVAVIVDKKKAPHARPLEQGSQGNRGTVRHPVFGDRNNWVAQPTRPFFATAILRQDYRLNAAFDRVAADFERKLGFK